MKNKNFIYQFYIYQKERFPILILTLTTLTPILSSIGVIYEVFLLNLENIFYKIFFPFIAGMIFMFNIRVLDELKDFNFDNKNHPERPIQRKVISLKSLFFINLFLVLFLFIFNILFYLESTFLLIFSFIYSFLAGLDFFYKKLRKNFLLYNFLCLIQLFIFQFYIYVLIGGINIFNNGLIYFHSLLILSLLCLIEIGRKLKVSSNESKGKDTYSSQLGKKKAVFLFLFFAFISFFIFIYLIGEQGKKVTLLFIGLFFFLFLVISSIFYSLSENENSEKFISLSTILFYMTINLLIFINLYLA